MKLDPRLELRQPVVVSFMREIVVENHMNFPVLRLIGQHAVQEAAKVLPLLILSKLCLDLASADFERGEQIQRPLTLVCALNARTTLPLSVST
jgi:hypothetical protein